METVKVRTHVGSDGLLRLELPVGIGDVDYDVVVVYSVNKAREDWTAFINRTYGALADDPIERPPQPPLEVRDEIE